ncbi:mandelate racemase/muconate lactonizing enzyme family protein, partial [Thermodesulfobacteriota bacterium]
MAQKARNSVDEGFNTVKLKIGEADLNKDFERVKMVREAIGYSVPIRVDFNGAYTVTDAIKVVNELSRYDLQVIEDPLKEWDYDGWSRLARSTNGPFCADLAVKSPRDVYQILSKNFFSYIKVKVSKVGGFDNATKIISIAESAGVPVLVGRGSSTNLETFCELHLVAAEPSLSLNSETVGPLKLADDIVTKSFEAVNGKAPVPMDAGVGTTINEEKLKKYLVLEDR